ncbi:helix-turn-helix domain-containing protein [Streptomyces sp. NPDC002467]|uniref:helix-turn-helix domain-containing protein n=1 Tax=Streptomyces sp. NPDC002467 TaxID=3364647 RepID=UPI0036A50159
MGANQHSNPVTDADREQVRALHAQGLGRNEIARRLNRGSRTISVIAEELGLTFDRTATAVATEARKADARARRVALVERAYARAEKIYSRLEADETTGYRFTSPTVNGIESKTLDHVPAQDERALAMAAGQHLSHAAKLEAIDAGAGHEEDRGILAGLAKALGWPTAGGTGEG